MDRNPYELFQKECPKLVAKFSELVDAQRTLPGLDSKTKQLVNIAIQTANRNPIGVKMHSMMAKKEGASREEILGAIVMNLHLSGLITVIKCFPAALAVFEDNK